MGLKTTGSVPNGARVRSLCIDNIELWQVRVELETQPITLISASIARVIPLSCSRKARRIVIRKTTTYYFRHPVDVDTIFDKSIRIKLVWVVEGKDFSDTISNSTNRPERVITSWELLLFSRDNTRQGRSSNSRKYLLREGGEKVSLRESRTESHKIQATLRIYLLISYVYTHVNI